MSRRYPIAPLIEAMGLTSSETSAGRALGLGGSTWKEYRDRGVTERVADRLAAKAGFHPSVIWPSWYDDETAALSRECAEPGCDETFLPIPTHPRQRFCSRACRKRSSERERQRRLYADPEFRAAKNARQRRYHEETRAYNNRRRSERYWANREAELARQRAYDQARRAS